MMSLTKICPNTNCSTKCHIRILRCPQCGHTFRKAYKPHLQTEQESEKRKAADRLSKARKKYSESQEQSKKRKATDRERKVRKKHHFNNTLSSIITSFIDKTKQGPDYICISCHRLMYEQSVVPLNVHKYTKASPALLTDVLSGSGYVRDGNQWICITCNAALSRGKMPVQAVANGLTLSQIPPELSCLNVLEIRLISLRVPFMKMVALPSGKQRCIHGPAVNVPSKLESVCTVLPRLPSQSELIPLKLKRKLAYKAHYMYDYVTPEKILNALRWLKIHNPLYTDVEINETWAHHAEINDQDLYASLVNNTVLDSSANSDHNEVSMVVDVSSGSKESNSCVTSISLNTDVDSVQSNEIQAT